VHAGSPCDAVSWAPCDRPHRQPRSDAAARQGIACSNSRPVRGSKRDSCCARRLVDAAPPRRRRAAPALEEVGARPKVSAALRAANQGSTQQQAVK
jgi:hypothetical protein